MLYPKMAKIYIKKPLKDAPEAKVFWLKDGRKLYNLKDLLLTLENMDEEVFRFHVNPRKNDFIRWIKEVLGDKKLARKLRWTTTRQTTIKKLREHLDENYIW